MRKSLFLFLASFSFVGMLSAQATYDAVTDQNIRPLPPAPHMGPAGTIVNDPTYGNPILRVTDLNTVPGSGEGCVTPATAMLNNWNANSTKFFVYCRGMSVVPFDFDPVAMKATRSNGGMVLNLVSPSFSFTDPNLVYGPNGNDGKIYQYDFSTNQYTPVFDLNTAAQFTGGTGATSISADDHFSVDFNGYQDVRDKLIWLNLKTKQFKLLDTSRGTVNGNPVSFDGQPTPFGIHLVNMDKSGRYLVISKGNNSQGPNLLVWDTANDTFAHVRDYPTGHYSLGWGQLVNGNGFYPYYMQWMWRPFSQMSNPTHLVQPEVTAGGYGDKEEHTSWNNARGDMNVPVITALTRDSWSGNPPGPWDDEIIGIGTDPGHSVVYRFGHTFALFDNTDFWDLPRGNVSPDGRFFMFTSNWRKTLDSQRDTFIIKLPVTGGSTTPPPATTPAQTTTTLNAPSSVNQGEAVNMTASVAPASATGAVKFMDGPTQVGSATLSNGTAAFSTSSLAVGQHSITAAYSGDSANAASTSAPASLTVNAVVSTPPSTPSASSPQVTLNAMLTLTSSASPVDAGQPVTFTVNMKPACASGTVAFSDGSTVLSRVNVSGATAAFSTSSLAAGSHSITATFTGEGDFAGSQVSATVTQQVGSGGVVTPPPTNVPVSSGPNQILNPGFETGTTSWNGFGQNAVPDTGVAYTGSDSARTTSGGTVVQRIRCYAGVPYMLTVWARSDNATSYAAMVWRSSGGNILRVDQLPTVSGTTGWTPLNLWAWAPYGTYSADIVLGATDGSTGSVWFDETRFGVK